MRSFRLEEGRYDMEDMEEAEYSDFYPMDVPISEIADLRSAKRFEVYAGVRQVEIEDALRVAVESEAAEENHRREAKEAALRLAKASEEVARLQDLLDEVKNGTMAARLKKELAMAHRVRLEAQAVLDKGKAI